MSHCDKIKYSFLSAVSTGHLERISQLISRYGLSYSKDWGNGYIFLRDAVQYGRTDVARLLLVSGSKVNSKRSSIIPSRTPLHFAVTYSNLEIARLLLDKGANINARNRNGNTPLHFAIYNKNMEMVELLLKRGADVNAADNDNETPLHDAVKIGCLKKVELLLNYGANSNVMLNTRCKNGYTPLHLAAKNRLKEITSLLLRRGANADVETTDKKTPLHIAAHLGYTIIIEVLLNHGACLHSKTDEGYMPIHYASECDNEETVKLLLNRNADVNARTNSNLSPLHIALKANKTTVFNILLQNGAKVDYQDKDGRTVLNLAVDKGELMIVEGILKYCPDINNQSNRDSLKIAVLRGGEEYKKIVDKLLSYGITVCPEDANDSKLLHFAVKKGYTKIVEALLEYNPNIIDVSLSHNDIWGFPKISKMLIEKGVYVNSKLKNGITALVFAIVYGHSEVVKVLLKKSAKVNYKIENGITPLHLAAENGNSEIVEDLLKYGAKMTSRGDDGRTALAIASGKGHDLVVKTLLRFGSDINSMCRKNITPVKYAMFALRSRQNKLFAEDIICFKRVVDYLVKHILKMKNANLYIREENELIFSCDSTRIFQDQCKQEIILLKSAKIADSNITFYDILTKSTSSLAVCLRNKNVVQVLKSHDYKRKFPIYADIIEGNYRKAIKRKRFIEKLDNNCDLFNNCIKLPYNCTEKILSYLSDNNLRVLYRAYKLPLKCIE